MKPGWRAVAISGTWLALVALSCALYAGVLDAFFLSDDFTLVRAAGEHGPFAIWSGPHGLAPGFFRPLASLSLFVDHAIHGRRSWGYHLTNVVLHASNAWLVGRIGWQLAADGERRFVAATGALLFAVWPAHGEPVAWIAGRTDVLAATFALASFSCYLRSLQSGQALQSGQSLQSALSGQRLWPVLALALFAAALATKESALPLPLIVLAHRWLVGAPRSRGLAAVYVACLPLYALARRLAVGGWIGGYGSAVHLQHDPRFLSDNIARQVAHALGFGVPAYGSLVARAAAAVLACALVFVAAWIVVDPRPRASVSPMRRLRPFLLVAFGLSLLPSINLAVATAGTEGERYLYFATAWLVLLLAFAIAPALRRPALVWPVVAALAVSAAVLLVGRNVRWREAGRLSRQLVATLAAQPHDAPLLVLALPDDLRDAYVLRNGVWDAMALWAPDLPPIYVAAVERLDGVDEPAVVERRGDQVTLTLPAAARGLEYWTALPADAPFTIVAHEPRQLRVRLSPARRVRVLVFDRGALRAVD